jgi:hypothetical protein
MVLLIVMLLHNKNHMQNHPRKKVLQNIEVLFLSFFNKYNPYTYKNASQKKIYMPLYLTC